MLDLNKIGVIIIVLLVLCAINSQLTGGIGAYLGADRFLTLDKTLKHKHLPSLWVHFDFPPNARHWPSWGSRLTRELNLPFVDIATQSIIDCNQDHFNIRLISDASFSQLISGWDIDLEKVANPHRAHLRKIAMAKLVYAHGGLVVPNSFLCGQGLRDVYESCISLDKILVGQLPCRSPNDSWATTALSLGFFGSRAGSRHLKRVVQELETKLGANPTDSPEFEGLVPAILDSVADDGGVTVVEGEFLGVREGSGRFIPASSLLSDEPIEFHQKCLGVYVPMDSILSSVSEGWFLAMDKEQILASETNIGRLVRRL